MCIIITYLYIYIYILHIYIYIYIYHQQAAEPRLQHRGRPHAGLRARRLYLMCLAFDSCIYIYI